MFKCTPKKKLHHAKWLIKTLYILTIETRALKSCFFFICFLFLLKTDFICIWTDFVLSTDTKIMQNQGQTIRAHSILQRKREKVSRKYTQPARPRRQLSPGFLEDALDEVGILLLSCFFWQLDCHVIISYWCKCAISVRSVYPAKCIIALKSEGREKKNIN
jgi:hypothetical protein